MLGKQLCSYFQVIMDQGNTSIQRECEVNKDFTWRYKVDLIVNEKGKKRGGGFESSTNKKLTN